MLSIVAYFMIILFLVLVCTKKMAAFTGLLISSVVAGIIACFVTGQPVTELFEWIKGGLFYTQSDTGSVSLGTVNSGIMILFAVLYFCLMMNVGLFDPLCTFLIRKAKGDPLKVMMVTVLTACVVTLDGDGTTTILIVTAAFIPLFKKMNMKLSYLAMMIIMPCGIGNCLPWGGPLARAASVIGEDVNVVFRTFLPVLVVGMIYIIVLGYFLGKAERKRLGYVKGSNEIITPEQIEEMCQVITETDKEYKRPKLFWFNAIFTIALLVALIMGVASGALLFLIGTAIVLAVNYSFADQPNTLMIPEIPENSLAKKLYSTYLSYLPKEKVSFPLKMNVDDRGLFTELVHTLNCGQVSINISKPGITKGQHWHNTKWEFFIVVSGHGLIQQRRIGSDEVLNFEVSGDKIEAVHMLPGYTHNIINLSETENLVTVMYCNEIFNPNKPDTYFLPVE